MMTSRSHLRLTLLLSGFLFTSSACVTVNLGGNKNTKPAEVKFVAPAAPFEVIKTQDADHAWRNNHNGNTISYVSACGTDPTLDSLRLAVVGGLDEQDNVQTHDLMFNEREAMESTADGKVDGVPVRIRVLVYKRNGCNFTLSYLGRTQFYAADERTFLQFEKGFKAP